MSVAAGGGVRVVGRGEHGAYYEAGQQRFVMDPGGQLWHTWQTSPSHGWTCRKDARLCP